MKKILAIDDQKDNLITIKAVLKNNMPNCEVLTALSGKDGIEIAREEQPDTILLDIIMPQMDGYEVCKRLKEDELTKHIPVVMVTAIKTDSDSRVKGLDIGADAFLSKPIDPIELSAQVRVMLRIKEAEDKLRAEKENLEEVVTERTFKLKESEEKYKTLYDFAPIPYQSLDADGNINDVNPAWLNMLAYKREEVIGRCYGDFLHPDDQIVFKKNFPILKERGFVHEVPFKLKHKDGSYRDISLEGCSGYNMDGSFRQTYCVFQDITDRKLAEEALVESEERYNLAMNATKDGIYDWNLISNEIYYTPAWKKMLGYEDHELPNDFSIWENLTEAEDVKRSWKMQNEVINKKRDFFEMEFKMKHKEGHWVDILSRTEAVFDERGKAIRMVGTHTDITERLHAEKAIKESEEKYRDLVERAHDGICILQDNQVKFANSYLGKLWGGSVKDITDTPFTNYVHPDELDKLVEFYKMRISGQNVPSKYETILKHKKGHKIYAELSAGFTSYEGKPADLVIIRDITDRKQAEEKLKESEEKYRTMIETSNDMIWMLDANGNFTFFNKKLEKTTGYLFKDWEGKSFVPLVMEDELPFLQDVFVKTMSGVSMTYEMKFKITGGEILTLSVNTAPLYTGDKVIGMVSFARDITQQKETELALINSEAKQGELISNISDVIAIVDSEGLISYKSPNIKKLFGWEPDELVGKSAFLTVHDDDKDRIRNKFYKLFKKENKKDIVEFNYKCKDGAYKMVQCTAINLLTNPLVNGILLNYRDISQQKEAEQSLIESETRFKALHNASFGGIAIHNKGIIIDCNQGLSNISGYTNEELIGADGVKLLIAEESHEIVMANIKASYEKAYEVVGNRKNGKKYPLRLEARMIPYEGKEIRVVEFRDITEQKNTENSLKDALGKATESDRLKSAFLATMSHELRTPLNAIIGFSDIIDEDLPVEEIVDFAKTINASGNHLLNIVEDLFDITLIESGEIKIHKEEQNLHSILNDVQKIIKTEQQIINKNHLELNLIIPPENSGLTINTDPSKLKQILINLLKNALKFTNEGHINYGYSIKENTKTEVTERSRSVSGAELSRSSVTEPSRSTEIEFFVEDTGIGIPKNKMEVIFDIFRQVDETHTKIYGGTGIGLSISKKLSNFLGGDIWVESEIAKGSTFYFTIPMEEMQEHPQAIMKDVINKNDLKEKTILIVEDDKSSFEFLKVILEKSEMNTMGAKNGVEAVELCRENDHINLVLMDINMPIMNGYKATKEIKKFKPNLPIIAQTAYAIAGDKEKALEAGCSDYISKPIKQEELMEKIGKLLS